MSEKKVSAICPECGKVIKVNPQSDASICENCGKPIVTKDAIKQFVFSDDPKSNSADAKVVYVPKEVVNDNKNQTGEYISEISAKNEKKQQVVYVPKDKIDEIKNQINKSKEKANDYINQMKVSFEDGTSFNKKKTSTVDLSSWVKKHKIIFGICIIAIVIAFIASISHPSSNKIHAPGNATDLRMKDWQKVEQSFIDAGFSNISVNAEYDIESDFQSREGKTSSVLINDDSDFSVSDLFDPASEVKITYKDSLLNNPDRIVPNGINAPNYSDELHKLSYSDIEQAFINAGFTNVQVQPDYDIVFGIFAKVGQLETVSIDGYTSFSKTNKFAPDATVIISYHDDISNNPANETTTAEETDANDIQEVDSTESSSSYSVLTKDNNQDLNALLTAEYLNTDAQEEFASKYRGKTIEFDCLVLDITKDPRYNTIFNYILVPGTEQSNIGATMFLLDSIQYRDFKFSSSNKPFSVNIGSKLHMQAEVVGQEDMYIVLKPIKTTFEGMDSEIPKTTTDNTIANNQDIPKEFVDQYIETIIVPDLKYAYGTSFINYFYDKDSNSYSFNFSFQGTAASYTMAKDYSSRDDKNKVKELEKSTDDLSGLLYKQLNDGSSANKIHVHVFVLNDLDESRVCYVSTDGKKTLSALD